MSHQFEQLAEMLNNQVKEHGYINRDNPVIWGHLRNMNNTHWSEILEDLEYLRDTKPTTLDRGHREILDEARKVMDNDGYKSPRIFGAKANLGMTWRLAMSAREIHNNAVSIHLPNPGKKPKRLPKPPVRTTFNTLFDVVK